MKKFLLAFLCVSVFASGAGAEKLATLRMTYIKPPLNVPSIVARGQKRYEKGFAPLKLEYVQMESGVDQTTALAAGEMHILNALGVSSLVFAASNGADVKIIGMYGVSPRAFCLYSKSKKIKSARDLKGKTIAGPKGTNLHELLAAYLTKAGMKESDVKFVSMDIVSSYSAMENGSVDCALLAGATAYAAKKAGYNLVTDGKGLVAGAIVTATSQDFYNKHKDIVKKFYRTQGEVLKYIKQNKSQAIEVTARELGLKKEDVAQMLPLYDFHQEITASDIKGMQATADFLYKNKMIKRPVNIRKLILKK